MFSKYKGSDFFISICIVGNIFDNIWENDRLSDTGERKMSNVLFWW